MAYYDLPKEESLEIDKKIYDEILADLSNKKADNIVKYFSDNDLYIRKVAYLAFGKIYKNNINLREFIVTILKKLFDNTDVNVRQTIIYACGEIACFNLDVVKEIVQKGLIDEHHSVKNACTGALKKAGEKNYKEVIPFCEKLSKQDNPEIRKLAIHSIELRGRTYPKEIIHILKSMQNDPDKKVRKMLVHILGQISYKKGCFHFVEQEVKSWNNKALFEKYKAEIIEVHGRYEKFSEFSQKYIIEFFSNND
jgi:HEAT repeat protein